VADSVFLRSRRQYHAPDDDARLGFSEIKLVIIDTAQQGQERIIEHDHTKPETMLIETKRED
jgi:hypothetical protein